MAAAQNQNHYPSFAISQTLPLTSYSSPQCDRTGLPLHAISRWYKCAESSAVSHQHFVLHAEIIILSLPILRRIPPNLTTLQSDQRLFIFNPVHLPGACPIYIATLYPWQDNARQLYSNTHATVEITLRVVAKQETFREIRHNCI